jgi:hypothetical protein
MQKNAGNNRFLHKCSWNVKRRRGNLALPLPPPPLTPPEILAYSRRVSCNKIIYLHAAYYGSEGLVIEQ